MGRLGVSSSIDGGVQASPGGGAIDFKWNFARGAIDLAVAPEIGFAATIGLGVAPRGKLPLLVGWNVGKQVSLVITPALYEEPRVHCTTAPYPSPTTECAKSGANGVVGLGLGLNLRTNTTMLEPEVTVRRPLRPAGDALPPWGIFIGMGISFGTPTEYEDLTSELPEK
jgi:hypothetical protein